MEELKGTAVLEDQPEPGAITYGGAQKQEVPRTESELP